LKITVRFYGVAYDNTGIREWHPELTIDASIGDLLNRIVDSFPELNELIYDEDGSIRDYLAISVNNVDIQGLKGADTLLREEDTVFVMPPIGGG
jgi:molybdopterin synthase sulfur carrier subunit